MRVTTNMFDCCKRRLGILQDRYGNIDFFICDQCKRIHREE